MAVSGGSIDNAVAFTKEKAMPQVSTNRANCSAALMFSKIASDLTIPWLR